MAKTSPKWNARGSEWNRWDPHIHAPGTALNDQFGGNWNNYLKAIEDATPSIKALGVTDYYSIGTYREMRKHKAAGRIQGVELLFPNVEMRLDTKTSSGRGINFHLIFSPDEDDHEERIEQILGRLTFDFGEDQYTCNRSRLVALGRAFNSKAVSDEAAYAEGVKQFKVTFKDLRDLFRSNFWLRENCLVAAAAANGDGLSGLQNDDSFAALREEMQRFAHVIFSGNKGDRDFWLGKKPGHGRDVLDEKYRGLKPCLHGCDAHDLSKTAKPDEGRFCWIKGDIAFESLRQAVIEPEERVWIGNEPPRASMDSVTIDSIKPIGMQWLKNSSITFSGGLIAVIGARGSGKTALVDLIAAGAGALRYPLGESSFLQRATNPDDLIGHAKVEEKWRDGSTSLTDFRPPTPFDSDEPWPDVCYLSQQFVDKLCSAGGLAKELRKEIERVIFEQTLPEKRFQTSSFEELSDLFLNPIRHRRYQQIEIINSCSEKIAEETRLYELLPKLISERNNLSKIIAKQKNDQAGLFPKDQEQKAKNLMELEAAYSAVEATTDRLRRRLKTLDDLLAEAIYLRDQKEPGRLSDMQSRFADAALKESEWETFRMAFTGDVENTIAYAKRDAEKEIKRLVEGDPTRAADAALPLNEWCLRLLKERRDAVKKEVGVATERKKAYDGLQKQISANEIKLKKLNAQITVAEGASNRKEEQRIARRTAYRAIVETFVDEETALTALYKPLHEQIEGAAGSLGKLRFVVRRRVSLDDWVHRGEQLLDLRKESRFRGHGGLKQEIAKTIYNSWREAGPDDVSQSLEKFVIENWAELRKSMPSSVAPEEKVDWMKQVGEWLFDTSHISIEYGLEYDGIAIEQLSPGTRGIVLLLLYLAVDKSDRRPLLIDQPEENLDPKSVFEDLVPHFREARRRRQVIIVTHNANLVVNTDADQIIVASACPTGKLGLPDIVYKSGSLENPEIRHLVCDILEGGKRAFLERERRYRLQWEQMLTGFGTEALPSD